MLDPKRVSEITQYILEHFEQKTYRNQSRSYYDHKVIRDGEIKTTGTDLDKILPPISRFSGGSNRALKKQTVIDKLKDFFEKYFGLV